MEQRLCEVLEEKGGNYILPFMWQHGEEEALLREGVKKIRESGIRALCMESRPHPDFVGKLWWRDMDIVMDEAKKLGMRVWVLDDAQFPTGCVNRKVTADSPYRKVFLDYYHVDMLGPARHMGVIIDLKEGETLEAVTAGRWSGRRAEKMYGNSQKTVTGNSWPEGTTETLEEVIDLTDCVKGHFLYWDVPEGEWTVTVIKTTHEANNVRPNYMNIIDRDAVKFFLDTVYEPHYAHYGAEFGKVFAGFFSDEPEFGNVVEHHRIGHSQAPLPWCEELKGLLRKQWKEDYGRNLVSLFCDVEGLSPKTRVDFMNLATWLYNKNFCTQVGDWCRAHGVEYIGHVIEDSGCHARLGLGTGHYFRALWGQDMAGIDVVLQQIRPGYGERSFHTINGKRLYDGRFFHHGLASLAGSLAQLDEKKKGRAMCEMYGAYGWSEGLKLMKWLTDHMLVRGINWFVPHAFTMKDFPDPDCPPHFYARGNNPQFPYFKNLMEYTNRISHLLNGGCPVAEVGVFYNACAEWAGEYEPFENVGQLLNEAQISHMIIPEDVLRMENCREGRLKAGHVSCRILVFPYCEYLPEKVLDWCRYAEEQGMKIIFLKKAPRVAENGEVCEDAGLVLEEEELTFFLKEENAASIKCDTPQPYLRTMIYRQPGGTFYMLFNEDAGKRIITQASLPVYGMEKNERNMASTGLNGFDAAKCTGENDEQNTAVQSKEFVYNVWKYDGFDNSAGLLSSASLHTENAAEGEKAEKEHVKADREEIGRVQVPVNLAPYESCIFYVEKAEAYDSKIRKTVVLEKEKTVSAGEHTETKMAADAEAEKIVAASCDAQACMEKQKYRTVLGEPEKVPVGQNEAETVVLKDGWSVNLYSASGEKIYAGELEKLCDMTGPDRFPEFCGRMEYEISFDCPELVFGENGSVIPSTEPSEKELDEEDRTEKLTLTLDCGQVGEVMEAWLNGQPLGVRIAPPYVIEKDCGNLLHPGKNQLKVRVVNTLGHQERDLFSRSMPIEPSGLIGPVVLRVEK